MVPETLVVVLVGMTALVVEETSVVEVALVAVVLMEDKVTVGMVSWVLSPWEQLRKRQKLQ